ncbi:large ribosomal subunit protein bL9-like [Dysidea avara]|uniref:large ribosomal subunit protein bL9-like n=1 Tax=Dysidea avara TaxID=196820 RepID=UPI00332CF10D
MSTIASHLRFSTRLGTRALHQFTPLCAKAGVAEATAKRIAKRSKTKYGQWTPTKPTGKNKPNRNVRLAVILTEDVEGVGTKGQYVLPKRKFARHELLWKKRAMYATPDNIIRYKISDEVINDQRLQLAIDERALLKKFFEEHDTITIEQDTSEKNWVLWEQDISTQLRDQLQLHVPLHCIEPADLPINSLGVHEIHIRLNAFDVVKMNIEVIKYVEKISDEKFKVELQKAIKEI